MPLSQDAAGKRWRQHGSIHEQQQICKCHFFSTFNIENIKYFTLLYLK